MKDKGVKAVQLSLTKMSTRTTYIKIKKTNFILGLHLTALQLTNLWPLEFLIELEFRSVGWFHMYMTVLPFHLNC